MKLVSVQRTGSPCFAFDNHLDRGYDVETGGTCSVTEQTARELVAAGGWAYAGGEVAEPIPSLVADAPRATPKSKKDR